MRWIANDFEGASERTGDRVWTLGHCTLLYLYRDDEPSLGLSPNYVNTVFEKLKAINKDGTTILLVEQNVRKALQYAHRAYVFKIGSIAFEGTGEQLLNSLKTTVSLSTLIFQ